MEHKLKAILSGAGFYGVLAVCLLAVSVGGYFLLLRKEEAAPPPEEPNVETPVQQPAPVSVPAPDPEPAAEEPPTVVETLLPNALTEAAAPASMPELEVDDTPVAAEEPHLIVSPLNGEVVTAFSMETLAYNPTLEDWRVHDGVDIAAKAGSTVLAACSGTVSAVMDDALMGTMVVIDHDGGYQTTYANLQAVPTVAVGDAVSAGQIIGAVGATAAVEAAQSPHLHFSVSKDGAAMDPDAFLNR